MITKTLRIFRGVFYLSSLCFLGQSFFEAYNGDRTAVNHEFTGIRCNLPATTCIDLQSPRYINPKTSQSKSPG